MSLVTAARPRTAGTEPPEGFRALFRFEARRLLRSPLLWGAAALCLGLRLYTAWEWLPDLSTDPVSMSGSMLLLAAAAMLAANLAVSRDRRGGMPEALGALPGRAARRTGAATGAAVTAGTGIAALVMAAYLAVRLATGPAAGVFDPYEALAGVLAVPFAAALGALLGRWAPALAAVPVTAFLLAFLTFLNTHQSGYGDWFLPVVLFHGPDWPARPSGLHVVYLVAAVALFAAVALLRHGARPVRVVAALAAAAVAVPAGAVASARAPGAEIQEWRTVVSGRVISSANAPAWVREHYVGPHTRTCEKHGSLTYCAFPGYEPWIPLWSAAVGPVAEALPPAERTGLPTVRQYTDSWTMHEEHDERSIGTFMAWGRARDAHRGVLASHLVDRVTGLRPPGPEGCDARGQARTVVALWLLGQTVPPEPAREREILLGDSHLTRQLSPLGMVRYGAAELGYARRLLASPQARERIWAHWDALLKPGTTVEQALPLLGLRPEFPAEPVEGQPCS
ncbi:ABC transporter [Planobispora rosea]|uniref:ABC transporter n=1 Tax=Planobispora rosea TaxID=35762 RepID=A0A8J3WDD1_PLARO|nr:hypothetical protein [Planobispora rosea]GGS49268.1 ABC transporter [Planobispora rosea]GIH83776.1 ABC transporter [Planobispora rosea]